MRDLDTVFDAYVECALWSSTDNADESGGEPMDDNYGPEDIAPESLASMRTDCAYFLELVAATDPGLLECGDDGQTGHDFWLTRNGHGAGFWDRGYGTAGDVLTRIAHSFGTSDLYVGDDGKVYAS